MPPSMTAGSYQLYSLSSFPDDIGLRREPRGSAPPKFPSSVSDGGWFRGYTGSLLRYGLSSCSPPLYGSDQEFPPANGDFYSRASGESVALLVVGYNYGGT
jgi:hypothetical protein